MFIYTIHMPDPIKLEKIVSEMRTLGAPTIQVVDCGDHYFALEGCHRVAAAAKLGLTPELVIHDQSDEICIADFDWYQADPQLWGGERYPAGELVGELRHMHNDVHEF